ncbi:odorant receptor 9a-like isoform X4 [Anoplolepis gracilipes]|uniref:odorant receptor 9a-like isoform X4 n=1 Tax=Anoplolepis gracilipes TaxID=354296 RepID=UPI003BA082CA
MSFYDNHYYYINKALLSFIGIWPFQSRLESNIMLVITLFFSSSYSALQLWGLIAGIKNLSIIMENASPLLVNTVIFIKLINYLYNKDKVKELLEQIEETWKKTQVGPENKILQKYADQNRTLTIRYAVPVCIAVDSLFILCAQHVCALFERLRYNMKRIQGSDLVIVEPNIADDEAYRIIIGCIKSYKHALKFSELLSSAYATHFLFLLGNVVIAGSFGAAELIMIDVQLDEIIRIITCNTGLWLHTFYLSMMSQKIIDHSNGFHDVIYSCNWYKISLRSKKLLRFTLLRASKPCEIKAGNMYVMSMENFSSILQVSMSYITMLTSLQ